MPINEEKQQLINELGKLYEKLKKSPERGFVTSHKEIIDKKTVITYAPDKSSFISGHETEWENLTPTPTVSELIYELNKNYGCGPETSDGKRPYQVAGEKPTPPRWYLQTTTHLSPDGKYYIVPVVYEKIIYNPALKTFFDDNGKLSIDTLTSNTTFTNSAKMWALEKLGSDLAKATTQEDLEEATKMAFLPVDSATGTRIRAEAWHIDPRPPESQNLFLKIMFPKGWVDALPSKVNPDVNLDNTPRNVLLMVRTLEKDLNDLQLVLKHFDYQILQSRMQPMFNALCSADKISKVSELLNRLLQLNGKPPLSSNSDAAIQIGFSEALELQYIAYAEVPDCLCDKENINAYILKKGVEELKTTPPFDSVTTNGLLYYIPDIMRKYAPYLRGAKKKHLFSTQESWLRFVKSYIIPEPIIEPNTDQTKQEWLGEQFRAYSDIASSMSSMAKSALYPGIDPTAVLDPQVRQQLLGMANAEVVFGGDDIMLNALTSEVYSIGTLFDNLLNRIPAYELIKIAAVAIVKCSGDDDFKKKLCNMALAAMTYSEIRTDLYPCLREQGMVGETAVANLEAKLTGRMSDVYKKMAARYPDKFKGKFDPKTGKLKEGMGSVYEDEAKLAEMNDLYCADAYLQKLIGRAPNDFSEEMLEWLEEAQSDAICDCILSVYGPAQQMLGFVENTAEGVKEIADTFDMNNARAIEQQSTVALDRLLQPFYTLIEDGLSPFGKMILRGLQDLVFTLIWASVYVVLRHVKNEVIGSLMKDICGSKLSNPFSRASITDMIQNSTLHVDHSYHDMKKMLWKAGKRNGLKGMSLEWQRMYEMFEKLESSFTPSELKRLFTTPCSDNSADDLYAKAQAAFVSDVTISTQSQSPTAAAILAMGDTIPETGEEVPSITTVHNFLAEVGEEIDATLWEDLVNNWESVKAGVLNLCDPKEFNVFASTLNDDDIKKQAMRNRDDLLGDIDKMMPLLDPDKIADMMPPLFCGPCKPNQINMKPLMPSQTDPSQLYLVDRLNSNIYKTIDKIFNTNISMYKPLITGNKESQEDFTKAMIDANPKGITVPDLAIAHDNMVKKLADHGQDNGPKPDDLIAQDLLKVLETAVGVNQIVKENNDNFAGFVYDVPGENPYEISIMFNFSPDMVMQDGVAVYQNQIKFIVKDKATGLVTFEHPKALDPTPLASFQKDDIVAAMQNYFINQTSGGTYELIAQIGADTLADEVPHILNLIFEDSLRQGTARDLFKMRIFNKIPMTDKEAKDKCKIGIGRTPILDTEGLKKDVEKAQQSLECVVSMFATPDAVQISNLYGHYKLLIKICIVEEYLKNIFMFGFVKISDILQADSYMRLLIDNVANVVGSTIGQEGYGNLLDYANKIVNGRELLQENVSTAISEDQIKPVKNSEESLKILILEAAEEISEILDSRIQSITDPEWLAKWAEHDTLGENTMYNRFLKYAVLLTPEYWSPNLYPGYVADTTKTPSIHLGEGQSWPTYKNSEDPWNGGLFYQPYVKLNPQLKSKADFWSVFKKAAKLKNIQTPENTFFDTNEPAERFVSQLIKDVDDNGIEGKAFEMFWDLFFEPEEKPDKHGGYGKAPFVRLVSSFNYDDGKGTKLAGHPYYYWDNEWQGAQGDSQAPHWAFRGAVATDQLASHHAFGAAGPDGYISFPQFTPVKSSNQDGLFYKNRFFDQLGMVKELFPKDTPFSDDWAGTGAGGIAPSIPAGGMYVASGQPTPSIISKAISLGGQLGEEGLLGITYTSPHDPTVGFTDYRGVGAFWRLVRDIIFDSPFWWWFNPKAGLRLNALFPMNQAAKSALNKLSPTLNATLDNETIINAHNEDKVLSWEPPAELKDMYSVNEYFCIPLDHAERDLQTLLGTVHDKSTDDVNYVKGSLGALSKAAGLQYSTEDGRKFMHSSLKHELSPDPKVLNELFPVKDMATLAALTYRFYMISSFPFLNDLFSPTKDTLNRCIAQMVASVHGDYEYIDSFAAQMDPGGPSPSDPSPGELIEKFMLMVVQAGANMVDKTWTTPWFMPGPLTPIGILAKILASKERDTDGGADKSLTEQEDPCAADPEGSSMPEDADAAKAAEEAAYAAAHVEKEGYSAKSELACDDPPTAETRYWYITFSNTGDSVYTDIGSEKRLYIPGSNTPLWLTNNEGAYDGDVFGYPSWYNWDYPGLNKSELWPLEPKDLWSVDTTFSSKCYSNFGIIPIRGVYGHNVAGAGPNSSHPYDVARDENGMPAFAFGSKIMELPFSYSLRDRVYFSLRACGKNFGVSRAVSDAKAAIVISFKGDTIQRPQGSLVEHLGLSVGYVDGEEWPEHLHTGADDLGYPIAWVPTVSESESS